MKKIILWALCLLTTSLVFGQTSAFYANPIESTSGSPVWYFIRTGDNNVLELPATGGTINSVATPLTQNTEGMFWRFEKVSAGVYRMINKGRSGSIATDVTWDDAGVLNVDIAAIASTSA